jgi:hypothetical protein
VYNLAAKRLRANECGVKLPISLSDVSKGLKIVESKNKENTKPSNRGEKR